MLRTASAPSEILRAAIVADGRPGRQLARQANVPASCLCRFRSGKQHLPSTSFDRVAGVLGYELRPQQRGHSI